MIYQMVKPVNIGDTELADVGLAIDSIRAEHGGVCPPEDYVERARPEDSPIHDSLPWDDAVLADSARRQIAREIIQCVVKVERPDDELPPLNVSVSVVTDTGEVERGYMSVIEVQKVDTYERQVRREMLIHIKGVLRNHAWLPIARQILEQVERCERESQSDRGLDEAA